MFRVKEGKINAKGLFTLLVVLLITKLFLGVPRTMVSEGDSAAWLLIVASASAAVPGIFFLVKLLQRFPGKNLVQIAETVWGRAGAVFVGLVITAFFMTLAAVVVREFAETMLTTVLPRTPISIITVCFLIAMIFGTYNGIEVLTRSAILLFPFLMVGIFSILFLTSNFINLNNLFPVLGSGLKMAHHIPWRTSLFSEVIFAGIVTASINDAPKIPKSIWKAFIFATAVFVATEVIYVAVLRVTAGGKLYVPLFQLARLIYLGRFIQRIESVYIFIWFFIGALKLTLALYAATLSMAWAFRIPIYQPLVFPISLLVLTVSFLPSGITTAVGFDMQIIKNYGAFVSYGLPAVLLLTAMIRKKGGGRTEKKPRG